MVISLKRDYLEYDLMRIRADAETAHTIAARTPQQPAQYRFEVQELRYDDGDDLATLAQDYHKLGDAQRRMAGTQYVRATITNITTGTLVASKSEE